MNPGLPPSATPAWGSRRADCPAETGTSWTRPSPTEHVHEPSPSRSHREENRTGVARIRGISESIPRGNGGRRRFRSDFARWPPPGRDSRGHIDSCDADHARRGRSCQARHDAEPARSAAGIDGQAVAQLPTRRRHEDRSLVQDRPAARPRPGGRRRPRGRRRRPPRPDERAFEVPFERCRWIRRSEERGELQGAVGSARPFASTRRTGDLARARFVFSSVRPHTDAIVVPGHARDRWRFGRV